MFVNIISELGRPSFMLRANKEEGLVVVDIQEQKRVKVPCTDTAPQLSPEKFVRDVSAVQERIGTHWQSIYEAIA